ncbi:hypothetical protein Q8A73_014497 [Channa argus]|nr:hypothetical protein Q8A73_014497 [Channa argus]
MTWVEALPMALMTIRGAVNRTTEFTPYELLTGRQMPGPGSQLSPINQHQQQGTAEPRTVKYVRLKVIRRKWSEPCWTGPFEVVERTWHAVRLKGKGDTWFLWSMTTPAEEPQRKDFLELATGYGDKNLWLSWLRETAREQGMTDCSTSQVNYSPSPVIPRLPRSLGI